MPSVSVIGAGGFVGSAFVRMLHSRAGISLREVTPSNYAAMSGMRSDIVIDAAGNSKKYVAEKEPARDFELSVAHRMRTLHDFPAALHVHLSSVDVYDDLSSPATTSEVEPVDPSRQSNYGFHKLLAEQVVRHYAARWLIVRLAGMVGPGLRKNPVFDVLTGRPLSIHPDSRYQFMTTDDVAAVVWSLVEQGAADDVFNVCGSGVISPREIAGLAGRELLASSDAGEPRIVDINIDKIEAIRAMPNSRESVATFVANPSLAPAVGA